MQPRSGDWGALKSRTPLQEVEDARLELPVAGGEHVIAADDIEHLGPRDQLGERARRAGDLILAADGDQHRHPDRGEHGGGDAGPLPAQACGQCRKVAAGAVRERAIAAGDRVGDRFARLRLQRLHDRLHVNRRTGHGHAHAADDERAHLAGMVESKHSRDPRPHRVAHDVGARDGKMIEKIGRVGRHQAEAVGVRIDELGAVAVAAHVHRHNPPPVADQGLDPAGGDPVDRGVGGKAVDEKDRVALAEVAVGNVDPVRGEMGQGRVLCGESRQPYPITAGAAIVRPSEATGDVRAMADSAVPHFQNDAGANRIDIGVREFMCEGATPPFDHPHVFLDMGDATEIVCPYCSTLFRYRADLGPIDTDPPGHLVGELVR